MEREKDAEKKKKKKKQEDAYTKNRVMRAPQQRRQAPPMPTNFSMDKQKMDMMRRKMFSQNKIKDAQMEMVRQKNMEIQRQNQMRDARQMNEQNMRVQQMSKGKKA